MNFELLNPSQIRAALAKRSVLYFPLGPLEFHGAHLPVGLDGLVAHDICCGAANRTGGLVAPILWLGTGGEHAPYFATAMHDAATGQSYLETFVRRASEWGVKSLVLFCGHLTSEQEQMCLGAAEILQNTPTRVLVRLGRQMPDQIYGADHAAIWETSLLGAARPELLRLENLPPLATHPAVDPESNVWGRHRHQESHPLYGIFGADPRFYNRKVAADLRANLVDWLANEVEEFLK